MQSSRDLLKFSGVCDIVSYKFIQKKEFRKRSGKYIRQLLLALCLSIVLPNNIFAKDKLPIPRFVSLKSNEVNVRTGPNIRYPIKWVFVSRNEPVEVVTEFENWRKIKDVSGEEGWIHESMLSGKRYAIVNTKANEFLYNHYKENNFPIAILAPNVRVQLSECNQGSCKVKVAGYKGWVKKTALYGVYKNEVYQ